MYSDNVHIAAASYIYRRRGTEQEMTTATINANASAYRGFTWEVRGGDLYVQADHEGALTYALATGREWNPALVAMDEAALRRQIDEMHADAGSGRVFDGVPQKLADGSWGVKIFRQKAEVLDALPAAVKVTAKSGKSWTAVIAEALPGEGAPCYVRTVRVDSAEAGPKPAPKAKAKAAGSGLATDRQRAFIEDLLEQPGDYDMLLSDIRRELASKRLTSRRASELIKILQDG